MQSHSTGQKVCAAIAAGGLMYAIMFTLLMTAWYLNRAYLIDQVNAEHVLPPREFLLYNFGIGTWWAYFLPAIPFFVLVVGISMASQSRNS